MPGQRPSLHVEGKDDYHALFHFLATRQLNATDSRFPEIKRADSVDKLLDSIEIAVRLAPARQSGSCWTPTHPPATAGEQSQVDSPMWGLRHPGIYRQQDILNSASNIGRAPASG